MWAYGVDWEIGDEAVGLDGAELTGEFVGVPVMRLYRDERGWWEAMRIVSFQISQ